MAWNAVEGAALVANKVLGNVQGGVAVGAAELVGLTTGSVATAGADGTCRSVHSMSVSPTGVFFFSPDVKKERKKKKKKKRKMLRHDMRRNPVRVR